MPQNLHIVHTRDFIRLDAHGQVDVGASKKVLASMAKACVENGVQCALLDAREAQGSMSFTDLWVLASTFGEMGFRPTDRLAVLHRLNSGERADFFAMCASSRGWNVRAFDDYEHAVEWFMTVLPLEPSAQERMGDKS